MERYGVEGVVSVEIMYLIAPEWLTWIVAFGFVFTLQNIYDGNLVHSIPEHCTPNIF